MQGFNMGRYVPPELEGTTSGNRLHRKRAPGALRKDGSQIVRFEMPFAVWCHTCNPHFIIGQGVRFNAEKRKIGNYYSTPIWSFRLKHTVCGGFIEIHTDPQNTLYIVKEGGKARDYGDEEDNRLREGEGGVPILTPEERERRRQDAFSQLEGKVEEKTQVKDNTKRIEELYESRSRDWDDPWSANKRVRQTFRQERKVRETQEKADEALKDRLGTDMKLLPENEEDTLRAKLVGFRNEESNASISDAASKPFLRAASKPRSSNAKTHSLKSAKETRKEAIRRQLIANTRAALNPFGK